MLKPLTTNYKGREITLECTHKRVFPPPQMYGHTPEDIDNLWKQGAIDQNQHQHLKIWKDNCGLMVMGPRCLDCPLALKQNPRPGRPHVIETESWLDAKEKMHWDDMKAGKLAPPQDPEDFAPEEPDPEDEAPEDQDPEDLAPEEPDPEDEAPEESDPEDPEESPLPEFKDPSIEPLKEILAEKQKKEAPAEVKNEEAVPSLGDDFLDALAED